VLEGDEFVVEALQALGGGLLGGVGDDVARLELGVQGAEHALLGETRGVHGADFTVPDPLPLPLSRKRERGEEAAS
jgi:hypothetical protein